MSDRSVFVIADSRGRTLVPSLNSEFKDMRVNLYWKKGLKLSETFINTAPIVVNTRPTLIYILCGICDLTYIKTRDPCMAALNTRDIDSLVSGYMYAIDQVHAQFYGLSPRLGNTNRLSINANKTKAMIFGTNSSLKHLVLPGDLSVINTKLDIVQSYKYLGLNLNPTLTLSNHIKQRVAIVATKLNTLTHLKKYLNNKVLLMVYKTAVLPLMEYSNITNALIPKTVLKKMQRLQNRALRIIFSYDRSLSIEELHIKAKLCSLQQRADKQLACLMFKRTQRPDIYPQVETLLNTRTTDKIKFATPRPVLEKFKFFPIYRGSVIWDNLSSHVQHSYDYETFKHRISKIPNFERYPVTG